MAGTSCYLSKLYSVSSCFPSDISESHFNYMLVSLFGQLKLRWFNWGWIPITLSTRMTGEQFGIDYGQREMSIMRNRQRQTPLQN
jgi:hypothetical protein